MSRVPWNAWGILFSVRTWERTEAACRRREVSSMSISRALWSWAKHCSWEDLWVLRLSQVAAVRRRSMSTGSRTGEWMSLERWSAPPIAIGVQGARGPPSRKRPAGVKETSMPVNWRIVCIKMRGRPWYSDVHRGTDQLTVYLVLKVEGKSGFFKLMAWLRESKIIPAWINYRFFARPRGVTRNTLIKCNPGFDQDQWSLELGVAWVYKNCRFECFQCLPRAHKVQGTSDCPRSGKRGIHTNTHKCQVVSIDTGCLREAIL